MLSGGGFQLAAQLRAWAIWWQPKRSRNLTRNLFSGYSISSYIRLSGGNIMVFEREVAYLTARVEVAAVDSPSFSIGTGFFYKAELKDGSGRTLTLLISNRHVFIDPSLTLSIKLNRKDAEGKPIYGDVRSFTQAGFAHVYFPHPDPSIDLACVNASEVTHTDAFFKNLHMDFLKEPDYEKILPGNETIFVGYPANRYDQINNLPLIRKGWISSMPSVDFNGKGQIVLDAQIFQGSSGSPVFTVVDGEYILLGVVSETMIRHERLQTMPVNLPQVGVQQILGLGLVVKQRHVKELIDHAVEQFARLNPV